MTMLFIKTLKNVFNYSGRSTRTEYWVFLLITIILSISADLWLKFLEYQIVNFEMSYDPSVALNAVMLVFIWLGLAQISLSVRRIRDIGLSSWWGLLFIPLGLPMIVVGFIPSKKDVRQSPSIITSVSNDNLEIDKVSTGDHELDLVQEGDEESLYEIAFNELNSEKRRNGLWAKALSESNGDEKLAGSLYIKYRVRLLKKEPQQFIVEVERGDIKKRKEAIFTFKIDDAFRHYGEDMALSGLVTKGEVKVGDIVTIPTTTGAKHAVVVRISSDGYINMQVARSGENVVLIVSGAAQYDIKLNDAAFIK